MRSIALFILLSAYPILWAQSQGDCQFGSSDAYDSLETALSNAKSCSEAAEKLHNCAWGSSADTQFAPIVITKCEKTFFERLSPAGKEHYADDMQLCAYEYSRQEGTMYMSAAALCQMEVAERIAKNPSEAERIAPRASFDCVKSRTPLETAICSDIKLGHADIVLARVYNGLLRTANETDKTALIKNEREWLRNVPTKCGLKTKPFSQQSLTCVRNEFEIRFTTLDGCPESIADCLKPDEEEPPASTSRLRASFDCEAPSTALEIVICADADLGQKDIKLAETYRAAIKAIGPQQRKDLVASERQWLAFVTEYCPLGPVGAIPSVFTRGCVRSAFETRIAQLQTCPQKQSAERISCLKDFRVVTKQ